MTEFKARPYMINEVPKFDIDYCRMIKYAKKVGKMLLMNVRSINNVLVVIFTGRRDIAIIKV